MSERIWILGASDPEMELIEKLLRECGETFVYATDERGERVRGGTAYKARAEIPAGVRRVYLVECDVATPEGVERVVIDHHRPEDPGYGRHPEGFFEASSIGQTIRRLGQVAEYPDEWERVAVARHPHWCGALERQGGRFVVRTVSRDGDPGADDDDAATACVIPREYVLAAAADHCPAAAYRGECPGVDPDELMRWRAESHVRLAHMLPLYALDPEAARRVAALGDLSEADEATLLRCAHLARAIASTGNVGFKLERGSDGFVLTFDAVRGRLPEWYGRQLPAYRLLSKLLMLAMDAQTYHSYCGNPDVVQRLGLAIKAIEPTDFELQWLKDMARRFGDRSTAERSIEASRGYVVDKYWCVEAIGRLFRSPQEGPVEWV